MVQAAQTVQSVDQAAKNTSSDRMKALAVPSAALSVAKALSNPAPSVSASIGSTESQSTTRTQTDTARGSNVTAGGNITIGANEANQDSKLTIQGSNVQATGTTSLSADTQIELLASANTAKQSSNQSSSSSSLGIDTNANITLGANSGSGDGKGSDISYTNTQVGGKTVNITSGADTTLKGAVVKADLVTAKVGGNLNIESLQDRSNYTEQSMSEGGSLSVNITGVPTGASVNMGQTAIDSSYASVTEQSGIKAGDGGFNVKVQGNTDLKGGAITSTQEAIDNNINTFTTASLTSSDIQNRAEFKADGVQVSVGVGSSAGGSAGVGNDSGAASSTTTAGISGIAGDTAKRTGDTEQGIAKIFDAAKVSKEINAQVAITSEFGKQATKAVETYSRTQRKALQDQLKQATSPKEKEKVQQDIKDVNMQERALNILVGAVSGFGATSVTKEGLAAAADEMRDLMVEDSKKFAGVTDGKTVLSNSSGTSAGINGNAFKVGGTRVDLDLLCGASNERCATQKNPDGSSVLGANGIPVLALNDRNQVQFEGKDANNNLMSIDDFLKTPEGKKMPGATGGIQGEKGTLFGVPYAAGSWQDKLIESFAGSHDFIGGRVSGLYDDQGNAARGRSELTTTLQNRWSEVAILPSAPFAAAQGLPPEVWKAIAILLGAGK